MAVRMAMIDITVISSRSVKPRSPVASLVNVPLPFLVARPIQALSPALAVDVPDVLPAPGIALGIVLVAAHAPVRGPRDGVLGHAAEELQLHPVHAAHLADALDQHVEVGRIAVAA